MLSQNTKLELISSSSRAHLESSTFVYQSLLLSANFSSNWHYSTSDSPSSSEYMNSPTGKCLTIPFGSLRKPLRPIPLIVSTPHPQCDLHRAPSVALASRFGRMAAKCHFLTKLTTSSTSFNKDKQTIYKLQHTNKKKKKEIKKKKKKLSDLPKYKNLRPFSYQNGPFASIATGLYMSQVSNNHIGLSQIFPG